MEETSFLDENHFVPLERGAKCKLVHSLITRNKLIVTHEGEFVATIPAHLGDAQAKQLFQEYEQNT